MTANLAEVLGGAVGSAPKPETIPMGKYQWVVREQGNINEATDASSAFVEFQVGVVQPLEGVDMAKYQAANSSGQRSIRHRIYIAEDGGYYLDQFLTALGLSGGTRGERIAQAAGKHFVGTLAKNKKGFDNITKIEKVA